VKIPGSTHIPPAGDLVEGLTENMCETANRACGDPLWTAAFVLWKLSWIHPFGGGNGRTARAAANLAIWVGMGFMTPGHPTMAVYLDQNRDRYLSALRDADAAWKESSVVDVKQMQLLLDDMLRKQLSSLSALKE
jgi:Fic family protein